MAGRQKHDGISFEGKVVLVTGAAGGIGRATALAFGKAGACVVVADISVDGGHATAAMIVEQGGKALFVQTNVTRANEVEALIDKIVQHYGRLDCAFNNAGISPSDVGPTGQRTHEMSRASFDGMLAVNLTGVFLCMKYEIAQMLAQGGGSIVNTASIAGLVGLPSASNYVASKHGVVGITKTAAMEYALDKIRVNCVNPGYIKTPMTDPTMAERHDALMTKVPMSRLGLPEEIAEAVVWMLSDKASFMTGASQIIDGGYYAA